VSNKIFDLIRIIAGLTREQDGWEQAGGLITSGARSRVKWLVPARSDGARRLTESAPRFPAAEPPGTNDYEVSEYLAHPHDVLDF